MRQAGGVAVDADIRGRGGSRSSRGNGERHGGFSNPEAVLAVVAISTVTSGVAYEGARLRAEENRLVDKAEAREARLALKRKLETDKAEARGPCTSKLVNFGLERQVRLPSLGLVNQAILLRSDARPHDTRLSLSLSVCVRVSVSLCLYATRRPALLAPSWPRQTTTTTTTQEAQPSPLPFPFTFPHLLLPSPSLLGAVAEVAEEECLTCVCIYCDGKLSVTACHSSGTDLEWELLEEEGTTHFDLVSCYWEGHNDSCRFPQQLKQLCKDAEMCCGPSLGPDCCKERGGWQCRWCDTDWSLSRCAKCNARECILDNCHFVIYRCDACDETYCSDTCSQIRMFKVLKCDDSHECELCPECYLEYSDDASMTLALVGTDDGEEEEDEAEVDGEVEAEEVEAEEEQAH